MTFKPTDEQEAIRLAIKHQSESLMINAYAGCAKTTTLELASKEVKGAGLALAFNRHIKEELARRFPPYFTIQTMNGLGHSSIARALPGKSLKIDDRKLGRLVTEVAKDMRVDLINDQWDDLRRLCQTAMHNGLVPAQITGTPLTEDSDEVWIDFCDDLSISPDDREMMIDLAREVLLRDIKEVMDLGTISFDDQVYFSTCVAGRFPQFPLLMVDEAQDLSPLNHEMVRRSLRPDGRLIVCGDPKQAIYGFRGADYKSMGKLRALRAKWIDLPLTLTFRCPKAVVQRQQEHAPGFRAHESNAEGTFTRLPKGLEKWNWGDVQGIGRNTEIAVLCRNNAPLLSLAFKLLKQKISVKMLGREIGKGLVKLVKELAKEDEMKIVDFALLLQNWKEREIGLAMANGKENKVDGIEDRAECIEAVMSHDGVENVGDLKRAIENLFSKDVAQVTLSSVHKAKGLEWGTVLLLDPWRIPSKQAKNAAAMGNEGPLVQEYNLKYVAETRAKKNLIHANLEDFE